MSYNTQQDILDFVEDNNVKFVRFAFCDIFGTQKNIAVLASDLPKAMEDGTIEGAMSSLSIVVCGVMTVIGSSIFAMFM